MNNWFIPYAITKIDRVVDLINDVKESETYYDALTFSLYIAVTNDNKIVMSSKHWAKNCYIEIDIQEGSLWDIVSNSTTKTFERYDGISWYVFINGLNRNDTNIVYDSVLSEIKKKGYKFDVIEKWDVFGWTITEENTTQIPWLNKKQD